MALDDRSFRLTRSDDKFHEGHVTVSDGYEFRGWAASGGAEVPTSSYVKEDKIGDGSGALERTMHAILTKKASHVVTLHKMGSSGGTDAVYFWPDKGYTSSSDSTDVIGVGKRLVASLPEATSGATFQGFWSAATGGVQYVDRDGNLTADAPALEGNATWYARWQSYNTMTHNLSTNDSVAGVLEVTAHKSAWGTEHLLGEHDSVSLGLTAESSYTMALDDSSFKLTRGDDDKFVEGYAKPRPGFAFKGWAADADAEAGAMELLRIDRRGDGAGDLSVMMYAIFKEKPSYAVSLDRAGGHGGADEVRYFVDEGYAAGLHTDERIEAEEVLLGEGMLPVRYGYIFQGYYDDDGAQCIDSSGVLTADAPASLGDDASWRARWVLVTDVELPVTAAPGVAFELGVPDGSIRVAGTQADPQGEAAGWLRSRMPVEMAVTGISCEPVVGAGGGATAAFWRDHATFADVTLRAAGSASGLSVAGGQSLAGSAGQPLLLVPAATGKEDGTLGELGELEVLYGLSLDRLFADVADGGAGVDIAQLAPQGMGSGFAVPEGLARLTFTVAVAEPRA